MRCLAPGPGGWSGRLGRFRRRLYGCFGRLATASTRYLAEVPLSKPRGFAAAWQAYLNDVEPSGADVPAYAAPPRATDLSGLPPAYVSVRRRENPLGEDTDS